MLIKILLGLMLFGFASCAGNYEIVSYSVDGKVEKVMSDEALENFKEIYHQATMQDLMPYFENPDMFKLLFQNRLFESKLIVAEALAISNFVSSAQFIDTLSHRSNTLPYEMAYTKGIEMISNEVANQSIELAEVSRIMITNDPGLANAVLQELLVTENPVTDFSIAAEEFSDEYLGAQRGGYMGRILQGQFPAADEVIFEEGFEGIYPQVLNDAFGSYLIFVHTKAQEVRVKDFDKEGIASLLAGLAFNLPKTTGSHACSYPLTAIYNIPHGEACGLTLDYFVRVNKNASNGKVLQLARKLGFKDCDDLANAIFTLKQNVGLRTDLSQFQLSDKQIDELVIASKHPNLDNNPVQITEQMLTQMYNSMR